MTRLYSLNYTPNTGSDSIFHLKTLLKTAGWTVPKSADGTNYSASTDIITASTAVYHGLDNARSWFVIQQPSSSRSFCIQRNSATGASTSQSWRIKYSKAAGFVGGSPAATVTPTATDEIVLNGAGTDASPTFQSIFAYGDGYLYRYNCVADNASPYGFVAFGWQCTSGNTACAFGLDPLVGVPAADTDPYVIHLYPRAGSSGVNLAWTKAYMQNNNSYQINFSGNSTIPFFYGGTSLTNGALAATYSEYHSNQSWEMWLNCTDNMFSGQDDVFPLAVFGTTQNAVPCFAYKGVLTLTRACPQYNRATGILYTISTTKDGILVGNCILPWDGSSTPLI
jgi:hypothetical protein